MKGVPPFHATSADSIQIGRAHTLLQEKPTIPMICKPQAPGFLLDSKKLNSRNPDTSIRRWKYASAMHRKYNVHVIHHLVQPMGVGLDDF